MKHLPTLSLIAALASSLAAGVALAECAAPVNEVKMPNGAKASKDEMLAAKRAITAYDAAVKAYAECLHTDQDAEVKAAETKAGGSDKLAEDARSRIAARYAEKQNQEVDKLQKLADRFNTELRAYKAANPS